MTVEMYKYVGKVIFERLTELTKQEEYKEVQLVGMSLGCMGAPMTAKTYKDFDHVTLVCPGSSLAKSLWYGERTQDLKATFEKNGMTIERLVKDWHDIEPENNLDAFVGKKVKIIVSKKDTSIPTVYQKEYVAAAKAAGVNPKVKKSIFGHYGAIIRFCLFGKIL